MGEDGEEMSADLYDKCLLDDMLERAGFKAWPVKCTKCGKEIGRDSIRGLHRVCQDCETPFERETRGALEEYIRDMEAAVFWPQRPDAFLDKPLASKPHGWISGIQG